MDALILSRWQFAITTTYHFLFVPITLGLSVFVALLETCYITTKHEAWKQQCLQLVKFFGTIFLINFAMGVVTGIVQEFHFGMNWSEYSRFMGDIFGAPLALEALTAFFLESTFLGIWVFGWDKLSPRLHCACIWIVAFASNLSAFWILVANSFMQHPLGYALRNGRAEMTDFAALITNPYVFGQYAHTFFSGMVTAGFLVLAVCAYKLWQKSTASAAFLQCMKAGIFYAFIGLLAVMGSGHLHAQYLHEAQPMKLSSMEALWETADPAPFAIVAIIDTERHQNSFELTIPNAFSFMLYNTPTGEVQGINELQKTSAKAYGPGNYIPDVTGLFWSFRIMLATGGMMLFVLAVTSLLIWKKKLDTFPWFVRFLPLTLPLPFIANSVGWYITEGGRQPWIVTGLQKTAAAVSQNITPTEVWITLIGFTLIYLILAIAALYAAMRFIRRTPEATRVGRDA